MENKGKSVGGEGAKLEAVQFPVQTIKKTRTIAISTQFNSAEVTYHPNSKGEVETKKIDQAGMMQDIKESMFIAFQINPIIEGAEPTLQLVDKSRIESIILK